MPELSAHSLEVTETLISGARFLVILVAARLLAETMVRFEAAHDPGGINRRSDRWHLRFSPGGATGNPIDAERRL